MAKVEMYYKPTCPYCHRAKALFDSKNVVLEEYINISAEPEHRAEMIERAGGRTTVPQIFINGQSVGGCDDLFALNSAGKLDELLAQD